jgi:hypothetical protein
MKYRITEEETSHVGSATKTLDFDTEGDAKRLLYEAASTWLDTCYREGMQIELRVDSKWNESDVTVHFDGHPYRVKKKITKIKDK